MICFGPRGLAEGVGHQRPTAGPRMTRLPSSQRASSPGLEQGGRGKSLIQRIRPEADERVRPNAHYEQDSPQSSLTCRRLAPPKVSANPTTPASASGDSSQGLAPPLVPSVDGAQSADAEAEHVPAAPTRLSGRRVWSASADDSGRSVFPLEPPSFAPEGGAAVRLAVSSQDATVAFRSIRPIETISGAWRTT
jgi:hypothetical protein